VPIYEYRCENGHEFEVVQRMIDDPVTKCEVCGASVQRVFSPVAVHYKGSGFYTTDYARKGKDSAGNGGKSDSTSDSSSDSKKSESKGSSKTTKSASD
jgi:putative FmdB family regulatory protein